MYIYAQTYMCISMTLSDCLIERMLLSLIKTSHGVILDLVLFLFFTPAVRFSFFSLTHFMHFIHYYAWKDWEDLPISDNPHF